MYSESQIGDNSFSNVTQEVEELSPGITTSVFQKLHEGSLIDLQRIFMTLASEVEFSKGSILPELTFLFA